MRQLSNEEIEKLATRVGVRRIAVENFLATMGTDKFAAMSNLRLDAGLYHWNNATVRAIADGIRIASRG